MEDSFRVRIDKAFGSLSSSSSSSTPAVTSSSLWCLTDDEIEKRQWTRQPHASFASHDDDDDDDVATDDDLFFKDNNLVDSDSHNNPNSNLNLLDNHQLLQHDSRKVLDHGNALSSSSSSSREVGVVAGGAAAADDDELDVRNSIGMDCTLDFEEEEDAYDKVAVGREKTDDDRLYMSDYSSHNNSFYELPTTFREASRDPRANHLAAKLRLQEDAEAARSFNSLHVSEPTQNHVSEQTQVGASIAQTTLEDENLPKSILKRKDDHMESKTEKRVRFEPTCTTDDDNVLGSEAQNVISSKESSLLPANASLVPDYVRHPLRYTHYTFDSSSDMNEESNRQAYMDFLNMVKNSKSEPEEVPADLSKPVIFNPKKKTSDKTQDTKMDDPVQKRRAPLSISEVSEMEVDEEETVDLKVGNGKRTVRKYRSKPIADSIENDS